VEDTAAMIASMRPKRRMLTPLVVGILVCMAVLGALLVVSVALPMPISQDRSPNEDPGKADHGRRK
jgi:hypothetical protein